MGVYYHYANYTKRERFCIDTIGGGCKLSALGFTPASRAFHLLLHEQPKAIAASPHGACGRWSGDSIAIVGDDLTPDWEQFETEFTDIAAHAILLVFETDGFDRIGDAAEEDDCLYMQLCVLIASRQATELERPMQARFGDHFWDRYKRLCEAHVWFTPASLVQLAPTARPL